MSRKRGSVLVVTMGFVVAFTLLGMAALHFAIVQNEATERQKASMEAFGWRTAHWKRRGRNSRSWWIRTSRLSICLMSKPNLSRSSILICTVVARSNLTGIKGNFAIRF